MLVRVRCPKVDCPGAAEERVSELGDLDCCPLCHREMIPIEGEEDDPHKTSSTELQLDSADWFEFRKPFDTPHADKLEIGTIFGGRYRIVKELGQGGMGSVYLAHDDRLDRKVALKIPSSNGADETFVKRFQREARAGAQFGESRRICRIIDVGEADGTPYLTMDYIPGRPLSEVIKQQAGSIAVTDAVRYIRMLAETLGEAHALGIIHRDLKPSNVMIRDDGTLVLMDFGLARRETDDRITSGIIGTPSYMSPEQAAGDNAAIGKATDIYSLGVILYELLTGRCPFQSRVIRDVLRQIVYENPQPPSTHRLDLDPYLDGLCMKALAKAPTDRFATMAAFAATLSGSDSPPKNPVGIEPPPEPSTSGRINGIVIGATVLLGLALPTAWLYYHRTPVEPSGPGNLVVKTEEKTKAFVPTVVERTIEPIRPLPPAPVNPPPRPPRITTHLDPVSAFSEITFVLVKPGEFKMGSPHDKEYPDETPEHRVSIHHPFFLGTHEVTQEEYRKVTGESPSHFQGIDRRPVENVSWLDAVRFCNRLSEKDGLPSFYKIEGDLVSVIDWSAPGYRLPTEAEWEFACRAGLPGRFGFANDAQNLGEYAWYRDNSRPGGVAETQVVGGKKPNGLELFDMQGNVWEWCWDWYADHYDPQDPVGDPTGPLTGKYRVLRGGTYSSPAGILRCAVRNQDVPDSKSQCNGFRIARTIRAQ